MAFLKCQAHGTWGPLDPNCPADFTSCFEDGFLKLLPAGFLLIAGFSRLLTLKKLEPLQNPYKNWKQTLKLIGIALLVGLAGVSALLYALSGPIGVEFTAAIVEFLALALALVLALCENRKTYRSSDVLLLFWPLFMIISLVRLRTLVSDCAFAHSSANLLLPVSLTSQASEDAILIICKLFVALAAFVFEFIPKIAPIQLGDTPLEAKCPEEDANIYSIISFEWVSGLMRAGYQKPLEMSDLWPLKKNDRSGHLDDIFAAAWQKELKYEPSKSSVFRALRHAFAGPFYVAGFWKLLNDLLGFMQPILLREMIGFVMSFKTPTPQPLYRGYIIATSMFLCGIFQTTFVHRYFHLCMCVGMHVRSALVTAIYQKALRLSNKARQDFTVGEIVNHMSVDTQKIQDTMTYLHVIWSGILQLVITLYLLYKTVGWAILGGLAVMILMLPVNAKVAIYWKEYQEKQMAFKDSRIKLMNEILNGIRVIKLYAWEGTFLQKILAVRNDQELKVMKKLGYVASVHMLTWSITPFLVSWLTFTIYSIVMGRTLTTDIVFTAIALFNILQFPLTMLPWVISSCVEARVALIRIHKFLVASEVDPNAIFVEARRRSDSQSQDAADKYTIIAKDATYSWSKDSSPVVSDVNIALKEDALLSVIGRVGSGKSSLIAALCGDLERVSGEIRIRGTVAFVPQQAWIMNDTLRNNIVFGNTYDPEYYQKTVEACCLLPDFEMLPGGDMTEIGERGINLSGGQKARISLARAVYAQADIYLLDDPLSAVDAHVGRAIFDKVIGPGGLLSGKTRILVTHQIQYLVQSTNIMMLREGRIVEQGSFQELMAKKSDVYQLVNEFGRNSKHHSSHQDSASISKSTPSPEESSISEGSTRPSSVKSTGSIKTLGRSSDSTEGGTENDGDKKVVDANQSALIVEEETRRGSVDRRMYWIYAKACSFGAILAYIVSLVFSESASIIAAMWLAHWSRNNDAGNDEHGPLYYISIHATLGVIFGALTVFQSIILMVHCSIRAARVLHEQMLRSVLRSPMSFFDTTPMGRILNRFSKDQSTIDEMLARTFSGYAHNLFGVVAILFVVIFATPALILMIIPMSVFYFWLQRYYLATSRELRRLESVSRSPVFAHFQETIGGISTIRAYRQQDRFTKGNQSRLDESIRAYYPSIAGNRWLAFRLEMLSSLIIFGAAFLSVVSLSRNVSVDPGLVGLSLTYALNITQTLNWMVRQYTEVETNIVAVERVQEYIELKPEAPEINEDHRPPQEWPAQGRVEFVGYETRYRPGLELVLRGVNCSILPHEKIGICGRTGAGKSSLTLSLFRIIESVRGQIFVDGIDISSLGLYDVRSRFSIIPQDPVLFAGTVRFNLDPIGTKSDLELWQALEDSYLKDYVSTLEGGLNAAVLEQGENFSVGQRQLICLARALLRKTSLLVLDEATAAIDLETDALVQKVIRQKFNDCTILTIAHRINTVMDNDRIMVLDQGQVAEFDTPAKLLADPTSMFYSLAKESGNH